MYDVARMSRGTTADENKLCGRTSPFNSAWARPLPTATRLEAGKWFLCYYPPVAIASRALLDVPGRLVRQLPNRLASKMGALGGILVAQRGADRTHGGAGEEGQDILGGFEAVNEVPYVERPYTAFGESTRRRKPRKL